MKTSGSLLSPSSCRWRRGHHCLSSEQGSGVEPSLLPTIETWRSLWSDAFTPTDYSTKGQISDWASQWTGACRQFLHCLGSYVFDNSALWCTPGMYCSFWYTLSQKHRKWYTCILDGIQLCMYHMYAHLDNRYMGQDILVIMWPCNMYFAQIYVLAEMPYGKAFQFGHKCTIK